MSNIVNVDVRGLSCPQPALQTKQTIGKMDSGTVEILVDTQTSCDNVSRLAQKAGWDVEVQEQPEGGFKIILNKK
ncbi:SirA family protein [Candidatus Poribacteria bacterium]|nr:SirA family protein [Candidatus Poribacteria bacterium]